MRIDKFLKNSRIIKRRTVAKQACDQNRVSVNGKPCKAGTDIDCGDEIHIEFGSGSITIKVLAVPDNVRKEDASTLYEVID